MSWRREKTAILTQSSSLDHSSTSSSSWLGCSTVGHWGPKALCLPLALTLASSLQLARTVRHLVILLFYAVLPLIYTGASLDWRLGRRSIYNRWVRLLCVWVCWYETKLRLIMGLHSPWVLGNVQYTYIIIILRSSLNSGGRNC